PRPSLTLRAWIRSLFANAGAKTVASLNTLMAWFLASHCLDIILALLYPCGHWPRPQTSTPSSSRYGGRAGRWAHACPGPPPAGRGQGMAQGFGMMAYAGISCHG